MIKRCLGQLWKLKIAVTRRGIDYHRRLQRWQHLDPDASRRLHEQHLADLLRHAAAHVPYYRRTLRMDRLLDAQGRLRPEAFAETPLLDKASLRRHWDELQSDDLAGRKWFVSSTGGSTGEPVKFIHDGDVNDWHLAIKLLFDEWTGYRPGMPKSVLWGSNRDFFGNEQLRIRVSRYLKNESWLSAFNMTEAQMDQFVQRINQHRPVQLLSYAECADTLARFIESRQLKVHTPQAVLTSAGTLRDEARQRIQRVFGCPVFNRYGSREMGDMACECPHHQGLHVCTPVHHVEVLRPDGSQAEPGEVGEIVVTHLKNFAMPMIRFRIGDMGAFGTHACSCGRSWPLLAKVVGRVTDMFISPAGARVPAEYFIHLLGVVMHSDWIARFQVIQAELDRLHIKVVHARGSERFSEQDRRQQEQIEGQIRQVMGPGCRIQWELVAQIPPTESGKYRYTICQVQPPSQVSA